MDNRTHRDIPTRRRASDPKPSASPVGEAQTAAEWTFWDWWHQFRYGIVPPPEDESDECETAQAAWRAALTVQAGVGDGREESAENMRGGDEALAKMTWNLWNMTGEMSTQWDELDEDDRRRWRSTIRVARAAKCADAPLKVRELPGMDITAEDEARAAADNPKTNRAGRRFLRMYYCRERQLAAVIEENEKLKCGPCCREPWCGGDCTCEICAPDLLVRDLRTENAELTEALSHLQRELEKQDKEMSDGIRKAVENG